MRRSLSNNKCSCLGQQDASKVVETTLGTRGIAQKIVEKKMPAEIDQASRKVNLKDAERLQLHLIESRKCVLGPEHPQTLSTMASLGFGYWNEGLYKKAEELQVIKMFSA